jgi:site-specific recombinase
MNKIAVAFAVITLLQKFCDENGHEAANLAALVASLRPNDVDELEVSSQKFRDLIFILESESSLCSRFSLGFTAFVGQLNARTLLTDGGILPATGFQKELRNRIGRRILPPLVHEHTLEGLLDRLFTNKSDGEWLSKIEPKLLQRLVELFCSNVSERATEEINIQLIASLEIISNRICNLGFDPQVIGMVPDFNHLQSPFFLLNDYTDDVIKGQKLGHKSELDALFLNIRKLHREIDYFIALARRNRSKYGITLGITYKLQRMHQLNNRLLLIINCLDHKINFTVPVAKLVTEMVQWYSTRYSLRQMINNNLGILTHQITEHNSRSGEKYITRTYSEYWDLFRSACGAGLIVGFLVIFKTLVFYLKIPPFFTTLLYCLNYAIGFVMIYLLRFTLATKQPAMTASTLSHALQRAQKNGDFSKFADLVAQLSRSQSVAFLGNVIIAFPVSYVVCALYHHFSGGFVMDIAKAEHSVHDQNPFISLAIFHASIAGFYLFLSGIIAGYTENLSVYYNIPERIKRQPFLRNTFSKERVIKMSNFFKNHAGPISGNISLGFFLGSTSVIGAFLGLSLDIRHITFSAGTFGVALVTLANELSVADWVFTLLGIFLIGTFNFLVSFVLSLFVALRSRDISVSQLPEVALAIRRKWKTGKREFFIPVKIKNQE